MATNKVVLREIEEFMTDYTPVYNPIYPLLLGKSQQYAREAGKIDFKRAQTIGDIRSQLLTPKDTEMKQIAVNEGTKSFKKYFLANQYVHSDLQDRNGLEDIIAQVLDEHQKQMDELMLYGGGSASNNVKNNGLFYSADDNYVTETSVEIDTDADPLIDMHTKIMANVADADDVAGRKLILFYGSSVNAKLDSLYAAQPVPFKRVLAEVLGPNYQIAKVPTAVQPASGQGWIIVNLDQIKFHYTEIPSLVAQGVNAEKLYAWFNFMMGSCMVDVLAAGGIIRQPATFEA
jgi:hypothetical protein